MSCVRAKLAESLAVTAQFEGAVCKMFSLTLELLDRILWVGELGWVKHHYGITQQATEPDLTPSRS